MTPIIPDEPETADLAEWVAHSRLVTRHLASALERLAERDATIAALRGHAEAMEELLDDASSGFISGSGSDERWTKKRDGVITAYRAAYKEKP